MFGTSCEAFRLRTPRPADTAVDAMQASHTADPDRKSSYRQKSTRATTTKELLAGKINGQDWAGRANACEQQMGRTCSPGLVLRCYLWYLTVAVTSGLGAGILAAGAGGRVVMRLLAVTAWADAQGRITEAGQPSPASNLTRSY